MRTREATRKDKAAIVRLCRRSVGRDYVPMFLNDFLDEGGVFVATQRGKIIGMMKYTRCIGGDGWLGAARTDPKWRKRGVATALIEACMKRAASDGPRFVRLWTLRGNRAALATARSNGFREVAAFVRVMRRVGKGAGDCRLRREGSATAVWRRLRGSRVLRESNGYAAMILEFVRANPKAISEAVSMGKIYSLGNSICLADEEAWGDAWDVPLEVTPLAGSVKSLLEEALQFGRERGKREVHTYLPVGSKALRTAKRMGFKVVNWGREAVLFERATRPNIGAQPRKDFERGVA